MIQRVSNQEKMAWLEAERSFDRNSMNKVAMDSFSIVVATDARKMLTAGSDISVVAKKYNLTPETIKNLITDLQTEEAFRGEVEKSQKSTGWEGKAKIACACDDEKAQRKAQKAVDKSEYEKYLDEAEAARENLHHLHKAETEGLQNMSSKRILKNKGDYISDVGGPRKQMGSQSSNTIFEPNKVENLANERDNGERIREDNANEQRRREHMKEVSRYETINLDKLAESIDNGELRRDGVHNMSGQEAPGYTKRVQSNGISIFDSNDFQRVEKLTAGEKRRAELKKLAEAPKDRSWVQRGAVSTKSSDFLDRMIQSMTEQDPALKKMINDKE
jgi:hypothetical protein